MIREREVATVPGIPALLALLALLGFAGYAAARSFVQQDAWSGGTWSLVLVLSVLGLCGLFTVNPNEGKVLQLFGAYRGTAKVAGLRWANPFYSKHSVSQRIRNFESEKLKVNDHDGNPIEIAAVVVWKVVDTA
jgi:regulator of protease activity HflC (stomatin/prohibitin superfamily)